MFFVEKLNLVKLKFVRDSIAMLIGLGFTCNMRLDPRPDFENSRMMRH